MEKNSQRGSYFLAFLHFVSGHFFLFLLTWYLGPHTPMRGLEMRMIRSSPFLSVSRLHHSLLFPSLSISMFSCFFVSNERKSHFGSRLFFRILFPSVSIREFLCLWHFMGFLILRKSSWWLFHGGYIRWAWALSICRFLISHFLISKSLLMNKKYEQILKTFFHSENTTKYSLENITRACEYFGNPQNSFKSIHIAGTNGKWSVSKMIFQMLKESGKKVWVTTSPHNLDMRERFETANCHYWTEKDFSLHSKWQEQQGEWLISEGDFIRYAQMTLAYRGELSYFERCVLVAFCYFRDSGCEYAIIEVGLWGRLDATNVITPILSIITSISYDHMEFLGDTLEEIAHEKWGIIKNGIPVILWGKNPTLEKISMEKGSKVISPKKREVITNLLGDHQISNARIAYEAGLFLWIDDIHIKNALLHVDHHGRLEYIHPNLLIDGAHNEDGMKKLKSYLKWIEYNWSEIIFCFNLKDGKSATLVLNIFEEIEDWNIVDSRGFKVSDARKIGEEVEKLWKKAHIIKPKEIFEEARKNPGKLFVVFGSLYMMSEFLSL